MPKSEKVWQRFTLETPCIGCAGGIKDQGGALGEYILADAGQLTPLVDSERFTLAQVNAAHKYFADNKHTGKIVIEPPS
ncbi:MAG: hypothetical protein NPIRA01_28640 [Nitrospirales bacterium]|nr:MAG: hypothetical protein NPIRA01_28640 [Nitrospirales bacterium]